MRVSQRQTFRRLVGWLLSGIRESNPHLWLGKPAYCHCTNPARRWRRLAAVVALAGASFSLLAPTTLGQDTVSRVHLDADAVLQGYTLKSSDGAFSLGVPAAVLTSEAEASVQPAKIDTTPLPSGFSAVSGYWVFNLRPAQSATLTAPIQLSVRYTSETFGQRALYIGTGKSWRKLPSTDDTTRQVVSAKTSLTYGQVIVLESQSRFEGVASWYRSSKYPYGAAANIFPMNSRVRVTSLETKKSVVVKIVSRGPYVKGRIIDLSHTAFAAIASRGAGLSRVRVEPLSAQQQATVPVQEPVVKAGTALIYDPATRTAFWTKGTDDQRSIASITKLMTALVVLDTNPTYETLVTMKAEDVPQPESGVRISVAAGQQISVRDLFYSMITASANNAALALARSTGLSRPDFVARMNMKAAALGLTKTIFVDPSGIEPGNVSTPEDLAKLVSLAMDQALIRKAAKRTTFTYTNVTTGQKRTVKNPVYLYNRLLDDLPIVGAKTGFINEAGHCIALVATGARGKKFVVIVLGSPTTTTRSRDARTLIEWAVRQF